MNGPDVNGLQRPAREPAQPTLFEVEPHWSEHWWGMPCFEQRDARPRYRVTVNMMTADDLRDFGARLGLRVTPRTDSLNFPADTLDEPKAWEYVDES